MKTFFLFILAFIIAAIPAYFAYAYPSRSYKPASSYSEIRQGNALYRYESDEVVCFTDEGHGVWCHWKDKK